MSCMKRRTARLFCQESYGALYALRISSEDAFVLNPIFSAHQAKRLNLKIKNAAIEEFLQNLRVQ